MQTTLAILGLLASLCALPAEAAVGIGPRDLHRQLVPPNPVKSWGKVTSVAPLLISDGVAEIEIVGLSGLNAGDYLWVEGDWDGSVLTVSQQPQKTKAYRPPSRTDMVHIPAGSFLMGDDGPDVNEHPLHSVYLSGYWIGGHEVSRREYRRFIDAGGYSDPAYWSTAGWTWKVCNNRTQPYYWDAVQNWGTTPGPFTQTDEHPVVGVSYYEAEAYCRWAGGHLPTEAQWEKAARWNGSSSNYYPWGLWDQELSNNKYDGLYPGSQTAPVGSYPFGASPYGCLDMAGNVGEWCKDWYGETYYYQVAGSGEDDPQGPSSGSYRVYRGGGWGGDGYYVRSDVRSFGGENAYSKGIGFRFATDIERVGVPGTPTGVQSPLVNANLMYVVTESMCNWGHAVEYSFDWGDGSSSPWSPSTWALHSWAVTGPKTVVVTARCQSHPEVHAVSAGLEVNVVDTQTPAEMIYIPAGSFLMGNSGAGDDQRYGSSLEYPQHSVYLSEYSIGKYEVTRAEYRQFMDAGGYSNPAYWSSEGWDWKGERTEPYYWTPIQTWYSDHTFIQSDNYPVLGVSYYEAEAYCNWAGGRLPTEAQWEKAARWNDSLTHPNIYPWGDTWDEEKCNSYGDHNVAGGGVFRYQTAAVGSYPSGASPYGCMDMAGNLLEWCSDYFQIDYYSQTPAGGWIDPQGPSLTYERVLRGGSWYDAAVKSRCASRSWAGPAGPEYSSYTVGFRVARDVERFSRVGPPAGNQAPYVDAIEIYTTSGAISFWGHEVEYSFDWGDGTSSPWSTSTSASHSWSTTGARTVTVTARCQAHPSASRTSAGRSVSVSEPPNVGEMVRIPAGSFLMGSDWSFDPLFTSEELPQHSVYAPEYWIGKYEVTRGEYREFMNAGGYSNPAYWSSDGWNWKVLLDRTEPDRWAAEQEWCTGQPFTQTDSHPVIGVSYYEAEAFCDWAGGHLPTEVQWEKAARWVAEASHSNLYPWGDAWDAEKCNCWDDSLLPQYQTARVGSWPSGVSPYGCHDMAGNASEWVQDWYRSYPGSANPFDYTGSYRVVRGTGWNSNAFTARCAYRAFGLIPDEYSSYVCGFRLAR